MKLYYINIFMSFFMAAPLWAGSLSVDVDQTTIELGEQALLTIAAEGSVDKEPSLPQIQGLEVQFIGPETRLSIINGHASRQTNYKYLITPTAVGEIRIPALQATIDGQLVSSQPIRLKVVGAGDQNQAEEVKSVFVTRDFSNKTPWVGEPVVSRITIYNRVPLRQPQIEPATPNNIRRIPLQGQRDGEEIVNGVRYHKTEIAEVLIPLQSGEINLPPFKVSGLFSIESKKSQPQRRRMPFDMFDDFFDDPFARGRMVRKSFASPEAALKAKSIPETGKPKDFSGLIGDYKVSMDLSQRNLKVGETATLTVQVKGSGNLEGAEIFSDLQIAGVKIYPDKPSVTVEPSLEHGLFSEAVFKFALVPSRPGKVTLGMRELNYFNYRTGRYETQMLDLGELNVTGEATALSQSQNGGDYAAPKRRVEALEQDLLGIHRGPKLLVDQSLNWRLVSYAGGVCALPLLLGFYGWWRRRYILDQDVQKMSRRSKALRLAKGDLERALQEQDRLTAVQHLVKAVRQFIGIKFDTKSEALTYKDIEVLLQSFESHNLQVLRDLFDLHSRLEYGGSLQKDIDLTAFKEKIFALLKDIDLKVR